ncbi:hypothetical protein ArsFIN_17410 [Arsenophonus nasoniae]|uniref:Uncharacterized protein n=1 Tax=Arsenophonus nasoniae TaxID=638 RepID=A0A4P7KZT4_9GAMM|nr:hypothetical protein ArsFIN_17410 [Arsenophonus nasoniae]
MTALRQTFQRLSFKENRFPGVILSESPRVTDK